MSKLTQKLFTKFTHWVDPKLAKYRPAEAPYSPSSEAELIQLIRRTSKTVITDEQRTIISSAMAFGSRPVSSLMIKKDQMVFVHEHDFLGPLTLDKLYKTGYTHFPVIGASGRITGLLHADALMRLDIKDTDRAGNYLDEDVYYMRDDYTLERALAAFLRTNCYFFIVINKQEDPVGLITYEMLAEALLGKKVTDTFDRDLDPYAVARR